MGKDVILVQSTGLFPPSHVRRNKWKKAFGSMLCPACGQEATAVPTDEEKELDCTSVYAQSKKDQEVYSLMHWHRL